MIATRFNPLGIKPKPYAYEVEYLESTGTQWIDTGVYSTCGKNRVEIDISLAWTKINVVQLLGANYGRYLGVKGNGNEYNFDTPITIQKIYRHNIVMEKDLTVVRKMCDGDECKTLTGGTNAGYGMTYWLFNVNGFTNSYCYCRCYCLRLLVDDVLMCDFIPVVDHDGVACMYDKVSKQLFYNQGTGEFIAGKRI